MTEQQAQEATQEQIVSQEQASGEQQGEAQQQTNQPQEQQQAFDRSYVEQLRQEAASYRTERNQFQQQFDQLRSGLAQALGLEQGEQDPQLLQSQLQQTQSEYRRERLQNAVLLDSFSQQADAPLMWAHLYASGALSDVDVGASDFSEQVSRRVSQALEANPKLRADYAPEAARNIGGSGSNPAGGGGGSVEVDKNPWSEEHWHMGEQARILRADREKAKRLAAAAGKSIG